MFLISKPRGGAYMNTKFFTLFIIIVLFAQLSPNNYNSENTNNSEEEFQIQDNKNIVPTIEKAKELLSNAPKVFTENRGQLKNDEVRFYAQGGGIWFTNDGVWFELREQLSNEHWESKNLFNPNGKFELQELVEYKRIILKQEFVGANDVKPVGRERLGWNSNFFYGNVSEKWCAEVPNYREVYYKSLYNGIDLKYYNTKNGLKYDYIINPGAKIEQIRIRYKCLKGLEIDNQGNLIIMTKIGKVINNGLFIYQENKGTRNQIEGKFVLLNDFEIGFEVSNDYCHQLPLIIDPYVILEYSSYIGETGYEGANDIAVDSSGNSYIAGSTQSIKFPTTPGANDTTFNGGSYDIYVLKMNPKGSNLLYSTFIGGDNYDYGRSIAIDAKGNAYITGDTRSTNFPTTNNVHDNSYNNLEDTVIFKLNYNGSKLLYSTYVGGNDTDRGYAIAVDANENAYVTGYTRSSDFPTTANVFNSSHTNEDDLFVLKLNQSGKKLIYSTYIGGNNDEMAYDIIIDNLENTYITGYTDSTDFPTSINAYDRTHNGSQDVFILKLNPSGKDLVYSTYIGGSSSDIGRGIVIDSVGNVYVTGGTWSSDFPTTSGAYNRTYNYRSEIFILKLNETGSKLVFSTYISGDNLDEGYGIDIDSLGNIYVTGHTTSTNFPVTPDAYDKTADSRDVLLVKLSSNGSVLIYSTYFGGSGSDYGTSIKLNSENNAYLTGRTYSTDFPNTTGAFNNSYGGGGDVFISKFSFKPLLNISSINLIQNNDPITLIYSKFSEYSFRINIIDTVALYDLEQVKLNLDPIGTNIQLIWHRHTGQFSKNNDPNNYIILRSSSRAFNNSIQNWIIDFNVTFNWTYPDEEFHDVQVQAMSSTLFPVFYNVSNFYRVENDLVFNGSLSVQGEDNRIINNNDLVRGGEKLTWTGLNAVYEDTINVYPPEDEYDITIWDEVQHTWKDSPAIGKPFEISFNVSKNTDLDGCYFRINISNIPQECDKTNLTHIIRIDGNNVTFSNPKPNNSTWQTTNKISVEITIGDLGGGFVNGSTVKRSVSKNDGFSWVNWESILGLDSGENIIVKDLISFEEGRGNLIKWQAEDTLGNGPSESEPYRILVDTKKVEFSNAWPSNRDISTTEVVNVGITITDITSGVNTSTIAYSISNNKGNSWEPWVPVKGLAIESNAMVNINITFPNGTDNLLKWRASDIAGKILQIQLY